MLAASILLGADVRIHFALNGFEYQFTVLGLRRILAKTVIKITKNIKINMLGQHPTICSVETSIF